MPNNGAYNNRAANAGERNVGAVGLTRLPVADSVPAGLLFQDNFDNQPDYTGAMNSTDRAQFEGTHTVPNGWYAVRQDPTWAPSTGEPTKHEAIEILASNANKARGGTGKCYVSWRDYFEIPDFNRFNSDSILAWYYPDGLDEVYAEFYISFAPDWSEEGQSKLFRICSWNGEPDFFGYGGGRQNGPVVFYDYAVTSGVRNLWAFRSGPHGENYGMNDSQMGDLPRSLVGDGDLPLNFTSNTVGSTYGADPQIPNKLSGGFIPKDINYFPSHEEIYGPSGTWTKIACYVKMNSAPGVKDGVWKQWHDDQLITESNKVTWVDTNAENKMVKWNVVAIGGNDFWRSNTWTNEDKREEWYAIDDVKIYDRIPESLT